MFTFTVEQKNQTLQLREWTRVFVGLVLLVLGGAAVLIALAGNHSRSAVSLTVGDAAERGRDADLGPPSHEPIDDSQFKKWYRTVSEERWFGSQAFNKTGPMDKTKYLTRPDCAAAEDAGIVHITKDCVFTCEGCEGTTVRINCNTLSEGYCTECADLPCPPAHFRAHCGNLQQGSCQPCEECDEGYFMQGCAGIDSGQCERCEDCGTDRYNHGCGGLAPGQCQDCPACEVDFFRRGCGGVLIGECVGCSACGETDYEVTPCGNDADRTCAPCSLLEACAKDEYRAGCGGGNRGACTVCPDCPAGSFREGCEEVSVGECSACPECGHGRYASGCHGTEPGACADCPSCPAESYRTGCAGWVAGECEECTVCGSAEYQTAACEGMRNRQCSRCEELPSCGVGQLRRGCGSGSPGQCESCLECTAGEYRVGCGGQAEGECQACGACGNATFRSGCEGISEGECEACPVCPDGFVLQGCGGMHRGACVACSALPCPAGQERVECGGHDQGRCDWSWGSDPIPPQEIRWGMHLHGSQCVVSDAGGESADDTLWTRNSLLRLGNCKDGRAAGSYELPWRGDWRVSFYVGVPRYQSNAKPFPAWYPLESVGQPDETDTLTVTINGQVEVLRNAMGDAGGDKLVVTKLLSMTRTVDYEFVFQSETAQTPLHMFASNGEAAFLGDQTWRERAEQSLEEGEGRLVGSVVDACDGSVLVPGKQVSDGYEGKLTLATEEAQVRLMVGTSDVVDVDVLGGKYQDKLRPGAYACQASYPGFYSFFDPDCQVDVGQRLRKVMPLCPMMNPGHGRFIMTWGSSPADMDLMLHVPSGNGAGECRVDYQHRYCQNKRVRLDYDVVRAYGPETITVEGFIPGKYVVHVRHFGGHRFVDRRTNLDPMLTASQAVVTYYTGLRAERFEVGRHGYLAREDWMVLVVDGATGRYHLCTPALCPRPA